MAGITVMILPLVWLVWHFSTAHTTLVVPLGVFATSPYAASRSGSSSKCRRRDQLPTLKLDRILLERVNIIQLTMAQRGARLLSLGKHHSEHFENLSLNLRIDGGGTRGLSSLYILKKLMDPVAQGCGGRIRPCEYFDLIGGAGINGLCALLFARFVRILRGLMQQRRGCTLTASSIT